MNKYKVLVHPVRSRIIGVLAGRRLSRRQMERLLPDVPPPTIYRNLKVLEASGVVEVVERLPRRGVEEHVYTTVEEGSWVTEGEMYEGGPAAWLRGLETFLASVSSSYRAYLAAGGNRPCPASGHVLHLTEEGLSRLQQDLYSLLDQTEQQDAEGRERYLVSLVFQPDQWEKEEQI